MCSNSVNNCRKTEHCKCDGRHSRFIEPRLLLMLRKKESYGYELLEQINDASSFSSAVDPGAVYRTLRQMENEGLVKSKWDTKSAGPARRIYRITKDGEERLYAWVVSLKQRKTAIEKLLKVYERR